MTVHVDVNVLVPVNRAGPVFEFLNRTLGLAPGGSEHDPPGRPLWNKSPPKLDKERP
jgi:hypothetical protein